MKDNFRPWKVAVLSLIFLAPFRTIADVPKGVFYFSGEYGHIYEMKDSFSPSLSTLTCSQPLRVLDFPKDTNWAKVQVGPYTGYVKTKFLSQSRVRCSHANYPQFINDINLEISDLYYWGRLNDLMIDGRSRVK